MFGDALAAEHDLLFAYLLSTQDQILALELQEFVEQTNAALTELHSDHLSPASHPDEAAAAIVKTLNS